MLHNDDTGMRVLKLEREPGDKRTGVFTSGIVSTAQGRKIALYFTGRQHAGENLADVLKQRASGVRRRRSRCATRCRGTRRSCRTGWRLLVAHCLAHGRRQIVEVAQNFPAECRYVLEKLGEVYGNDAEARDAGLTPEERLQLPSGAQQADDGRAARLAGGAVCRAEDGAELGSGQGDHVSAAALAAADAVSAASWGATGQQPWSKEH